MGVMVNDKHEDGEWKMAGRCAMRDGAGLRIAYCVGRGEEFWIGDFALGMGRRRKLTRRRGERGERGGDRGKCATRDGVGACGVENWGGVRLRPAWFASVRLIWKNFPRLRVWGGWVSSGFWKKNRYCSVLLGLHFWKFHLPEVLAHGHREQTGDKVNLELHTRSQGQSNLVKPSQTNARR